MAEAAVEESLSRLYFCHQCSVEIPRVLPDFTCPTCSTGFIEELETPPGNVSNDGNMDQEDLSGMDLLNQRLGEELSEILLGVGGFGGAERRARHRDGAETRRPGRYGGVLPRARNIRNRAASREAGGAARQVAPIEMLIQDFIVNLTSGGAGGGGAWPGGLGFGRGANNPVLFLGNPGDYAWGREGLDAIVTQLLNQMDGAGPPPLAKDKIKEIPVVHVTQDQVGKSLQCSVCWEDFRLEEPVRKLPCEHVYHENCIIPWLELHGTCPVCRQSLAEDGLDETQANLANNPLGGVNVGPSLAAFFRAANNPAPGSSRTSSSSSSSSSSSASSGSTTSANTSGTSTSSSGGGTQPTRDFNMDLEFD